MNRTYRLLIRCFIYLVLAFYCIAVALLNSEDVFEERTEFILSLSCVGPMIGAAFGAVDLATYRAREKERVLRTGEPVTGRIVEVSYPFATSRKREDSSSIIMMSTPLGGKEPVIVHTLIISYTYKGKRYKQESRMRSGVCGRKAGELVDIWVDRENPKNFYLYT